MNPVLKQILGPLVAHYGIETTTEIRMTCPGKVITDRRGEGKRFVQDSDLSLGTVETIARTLANANGLQFNGDTESKLSCVLPGGHRFECLVGPSVQSGLSLAIRCKHPFTPSWKQAGADEEVVDYLKYVVLEERNLVVSGATNTGKTTVLNMLLAELPKDRRVIAVEDTPELFIDKFWDGVGLLAAREANTSSGMVTWRELYDHLMRITPDHIVFGEISTQNAYASLAALNSGVTGFMCTIHAESPHQALNRKFDQNIKWAGETMDNVPEFLSELVDVVLQIKRDKTGWRRITDIYEPKADRFFLKDGELQ